MFPFLLPALGLGLIKHFAVDKPRENRDRKLAAETIRYSPWTHMQPGQIRQADPLSTTMQFGLAGAQMGQANEAFELDKNLKEAYTSALNRSGSAPAMSLGGQNSNPWSLGVTTKLPTYSFGDF